MLSSAQVEGAWAVELELHQLTLRFERLRKRQPREERSLLVSLSEIGQQLPVAVIQEAPSFILIDGYKRVRALKRLARDTVHATCRQVAESEALFLERGLRRGSEDALDQAWLLAKLQALPASIQEQIRAGVISAHAAMKYLVPLARVNAAAAQRFLQDLGALAAIARRANRILEGCLLAQLSAILGPR